MCSSSPSEFREAAGDHCRVTGLYLLLGFMLGYGAIAGGFLALGAQESLALSALLACFVLGLCAELLALVLGGGQTAQRLVSWLMEIPIAKLRTGLTHLADRMVAADGHAVRFFRAPRLKRWGLASHYLCAWLMEACETWLILILVGAAIDFGQALGVETVVVLVRHVLFVLPAGLGAQELGYAIFLGALGVNMEQSAAFVVLKRIKELLWIFVGYCLFIGDGSSRLAPLWFFKWGYSQRT